MTAGRELDALIAEKVFGWHCVGQEHCKECHYTWVDPEGAPNDFPEYSTDMGAVWEVVEKLKHDRLFLCLEYDSVDVWDAIFYKQSKTDGGILGLWSSSETAQHAICLAALRAVGCELPQEMA